MRVAFLIDGGFFLKRLPLVRPDIDSKNPVEVENSITQLVRNHLVKFNKIYKHQDYNIMMHRCYFYDGKPYSQISQHPVTKKPIDYDKSEEAEFRRSLFELLKRRRNFALRLGEIHLNHRRPWKLSADAQRDILSKERTIDDLGEHDFIPNFRQKAVDMRIGVDIATLSLKKQVDTIVLVTGDADFVPAAKLARREGVKFILDPLWNNLDTRLLDHKGSVTLLENNAKLDSSKRKPISQLFKRKATSDLFEHIDGLQSGFSRPQKKLNVPHNTADNDPPGGDKI